MCEETVFTMYKSEYSATWQKTVRQTSDKYSPREILHQ